jgi:membrane protein YdbS with pleckstrin-like domain
VGRFVNYFNLASVPPDARKAMPVKGVLLQYLILVLGIVVQPFFAAFRAQGAWVFTGQWGWIVFAAVVGVVVFPAVYRNSFNPQKPLFVQLCAIFTAGMGWESLLGTALSAV